MTPELTSWAVRYTTFYAELWSGDVLVHTGARPAAAARATILTLLARRCNARRHAECGAAVSYVRFITYADVLQAHDLLAVR